MSFFQKNKFIVIPLILWLIIIGAFWIFAYRHNLSPLDIVQWTRDFLVNHPYGPLIFLVLLTIRPLFLFPNMLAILFAGFLYGPFWGFAYALSGDIISAMVAYGIGFFYGPSLFQSMEKQDRIRQLVDSLRRKAYEIIFKTRLILLQYDLVSYSAGIGQINWRSFFGATVLGSLAGTAALVLLGSSIDVDTASGMVRLNPMQIAGAILVFMLSLAVAWYLHRRPNEAEDASS